MSVITPKGTKPNTQHRTTKGTYATYEQARLAGLMYEGAGTVSIKRKRDHFTLRIDSRPKICGEDFMAGAVCVLLAGHGGSHRSGE
jgi:hypothetical protein